MLTSLLSLYPRQNLVHHYHHKISVGNKQITKCRSTIGYNYHLHRSRDSPWGGGFCDRLCMLLVVLSVVRGWSDIDGFNDISVCTRV